MCALWSKIDDWVCELESFLNSYNLQHLSLYHNIEEGTKFFNDHKNGRIKLIDNDTAAEFYNISNKVLVNINLKKEAELCKKGFKCEHNLNYWNSKLDWCRTRCVWKIVVIR